MQVASATDVHEWHERHVQTILLNQNVEFMNEIDDFQQKLHEKIYVERQSMLNDADTRLQMHTQRWELGQRP